MHPGKALADSDKTGLWGREGRTSLRWGHGLSPHPPPSPNSRCGQGHAPSGGSVIGSFLPLPAPGGSRHPWACGCITLRMSSHELSPVCLWLFFCLLQGHLSSDLGPFSPRIITFPDLSHSIPPAKTLFPSKVLLTSFQGMCLLGAWLRSWRGWQGRRLPDAEYFHSNCQCARPPPAGRRAGPDLSTSPPPTQGLWKDRHL